MSAFNLQHLIREVPGKTWRDYLAARAIEVSPDFDWAAEEVPLAAALMAEFTRIADHERVAAIHAELRRVHRLGNPKGVYALLNASHNCPELQETFEQLCNPLERALWALVHRPADFPIAERMLQFDRGFGTRAWKRHAIQVSEPVSRQADDVRAFQDKVSQLMSRRKGPQRACQVDICDRFLDGGVQVSLYIEDDPNDVVEFVEADMKRRTTRPAGSMALVYHPLTGLVDSIGRGGAKVRVGVVTLFAKHLLKRDVKPAEVKQPMFHLNRLRYGLNFLDDRTFDPAAQGVDHIRLRQARLRSTKPPLGDFWVEAPADPDQASAYEFSAAHLGDWDLFRSDFNLIEAVISVQFVPSEPGKAGRVLSIALKHTGVSNLRDLSETDAQFAEALLKALQVSEPTDLEVQRAA